MKKSIVSSLLATAICLNAFAWGQKGHDVTAYIAEQHLTPTTKAAVESLFDGKSIVYWANWLDNASHQRELAYTKTWHYKNVDEGVRYEEAPANPAGDAVTAIKSRIEILNDPNASLEDQVLALKILVHVVGDLHMPLHMGHATDLGGNRVKVKYFNRDNNLHSVWDTSIPESAHKWSYTEWQQQIDRLNPAEEAAVISGSIDDWAKETVAIASDVYAYFQPEANISYNEVADWTPTVEQQFLRGGLRLAHLLNSIFDPEYTAPQ
ncbi:MAG: S1/P1 nuclease [Muribaculaceae bacterium]|nr:S1/P1 nuclease [Muribaculaceae bacterium]